MALLTVEDVSLRFGGLQVLAKVSFSLEHGAIHSLIGPNGAGKTSLFNCLTGFYEPTSGKIVFDSLKLSSLPPYKITQRGVARTFACFAK